MFLQLQALQKLMQLHQRQKLHQCIRIIGKKGLGKKHLVLEFVKQIFTQNLNNEQEIEAVIQQINNSIHPNILLIPQPIIEQDDKKKDKKKAELITVDEVRVLAEFLQKSARGGQDRFIIINTVDNLNLNAANSILKWLEEPPDNTYFFLLNCDTENILDTIKSRSVELYLTEPKIQDRRNYLKETNSNLTEQQITILLEILNLMPQVASELLEKKIFNYYDTIIDILYNYPEINYTKLLEMTNNMRNTATNEVISVTDIIMMLDSMIYFLIINLAKNNKDLDSNYGQIAILYQNLVNQENIISILYNWKDKVNMMAKQAHTLNLDSKTVIKDIFYQLEVA